MGEWANVENAEWLKCAELWLSWLGAVGWVALHIGTLQISLPTLIEGAVASPPAFAPSRLLHPTPPQHSLTSMLSLASYIPLPC